jgi:hypothetical protein
MNAVRVVLPQHLRTLARVSGEVTVEVEGRPTVGKILDAIERTFPVLQGTIRDHGTRKRRPFIRFYACEEDFSLGPPDTPLPEKIGTGDEPFLVIGAIAGG